MVNIAVKAARRAGRIINQATGNLDVLTVRHKSLNDLVSEVDRAAEAAIIDTLRTAYPEHAILAEESGAAGQSDYVWIIDPPDFDLKTGQPGLKPIWHSERSVLYRVDHSYAHAADTATPRASIQSH